MMEKLEGEPLVILLVEDNPAHAEMVLRTLADHRIVNEIRHVSDGEEALEYLFRRGKYKDAEKSPRPHVILLDLRLPKVDGLEVLKEVKKAKDLQNIPVVVLTTSDSEKDIVKAYESYVNSYLVKPVDFRQFSKMMEDVGFYWLGWNKKPW